jgi:aspartate kinase
MGIIVKKFGGSSLGDVSRLINVAQRLYENSKSGEKTVVVVSAMGGLTDTLVGEYQKVSLHSGAEFDAVASAGEQISAGLLAQELQNLGMRARSWLGWQLPIQTNDNYGFAEIINVDTTRIMADIEEGIMPIITGFQGVDANNRITTLGRGGSDLTAVAMGVALNADKCDIYTDVPGVYELDPKKNKASKKMPSLTYEEMIALVNEGAGVVDLRAVKLAQKNNLKLEVLSSFENVSGTIIS